MTEFVFFVFYFRIFLENFNLIGNFTGKLFNNFAHAQAVSSRPTCGGLVKEASLFVAIRSFFSSISTKKTHELYNWTKNISYGISKISIMYQGVGYPGVRL